MATTFHVEMTGTDADRIYYNTQPGVELTDSYFSIADPDYEGNKQFLAGIEVDVPLVYYVRGAIVDGDRTSDLSDERKLTFTMRERVVGPPPLPIPSIDGLLVSVTVTDGDENREMTIEVI